MATFAELKCFNKLLLEKMKRQQEQIKALKKKEKELEHIEKKYESLDWAMTYSMEYPPCCGICDLYEREHNIINYTDNIGDICRSCAQEYKFFECESCEEKFFEIKCDEKELEISPKCKSKIENWECCITCYKEEIKNNYKKVMDEIKGAFEKRQYNLNKKKYNKVIKEIGEWGAEWYYKFYGQDKFYKRYKLYGFYSRGWGERSYYFHTHHNRPRKDWNGRWIHI